MSTRMRTLFVRQVALALVALLATAGAGLASQTRPGADRPHKARSADRSRSRGATASDVRVLTVPSVERRPYVFAKGMLEEAGFAWRLVGRVRGYPSNFVVAQRPRAGTSVVDNGAPTITLVLERNDALPERGVPVARSPYRGTPPVAAASK
ncbi:MAG: PASTA domain-containing protein [Actinomycetota bacterium]|nr:PASTA domain-containing protein [Actinomycetota bacterium]